MMVPQQIQVFPRLEDTNFSTWKFRLTTILDEQGVSYDTLIRELEGMGSKIDQNDKVCHLLLTVPEK